MARKAWDGMLTRDVPRRIRAMLESPGRRAHADSSLRYLLSGAARCGACGQPLRVRARERYNCVALGCMKVAASRPFMDEAVTEVELERLRRIDGGTVFAPDQDDAQVVAARRELHELQEHLEGFYTQAAQRKLSAEGLARVEAQIRPKIAALEQRIRRLSSPPALAALAGVDVPAVWDILSVG